MNEAAPVSVIIPSFNRRHLIGAAIDSVLAQTTKAAEIIVVDDGSSDGTAGWLNEVYGDAVRCITQENAGVAAARNTGLEAARFELVAFLDSDDRWPAEKLAKQIPLMANPNILLSATNWRWEGAKTDGFGEIGYTAKETDMILTDPLVRLCSTRGHGILIQTCIIRREVLIRLGGFNRTLRIAEDMDLIFRIACEGMFRLTSDVLMTRGVDDRSGNLTDPESVRWQAENLENTIGILLNTLASQKPLSRAAKRALEARMVQLISYRAKLAAQQGDFGLARSYCQKALPHLGGSKPALICLAGLLFPRLLARQRR